MAHVEIVESALVQAPAARAYALIADYRDGHRRIVPPRAFKWLRVDSGGTGAGTAIAFEMRVLGTSNVARAMVSEPQPGRLLVETDVEGRVITTFTVDPRGPGACHVTIATTLKPRVGIAGWIEAFVSRRILPPLYREELQRLAEHAEGRQVHAPVPQGPGA